MNDGESAINGDMGTHVSHPSTLLMSKPVSTLWDVDLKEQKRDAVGILRRERRGYVQMMGMGRGGG